MIVGECLSVVGLNVIFPHLAIAFEAFVAVDLGGYIGRKLRMFAAELESRVIPRSIKADDDDKNARGEQT